MALTSTLFTGLSGLDVNQTRLNVVGNNIANVNTIAFKASRALFKPQFYVTDKAGTPASGDFGGTNPSQRGLGATLATIEKDYSTGSIEPTGKATDLAIDGDGFFVVQGKEQKFTRDGSFVLNQSNQLVTSSGDFVQGFGVDPNGNIIRGELRNITIPLGSMTRAQPTENVVLEGNLNANGLLATGGSVLISGALVDSVGAPITATTQLSELRDPTAPATPLVAVGDRFTIRGKKGGRELPELTYTVQAGNTVQNLLDFINQGLGIDTSVNGAGASVGADPTDPPGTTRIMVRGNFGSENALSLAGTAFNFSGSTTLFTFSEATNSNPNGESVYTSFVVYDSLGTPLTVNLTAVLEDKSDAGNTWRFYAHSANDTDATPPFDPARNPPSPGAFLGSGTLTFDSDGKLQSSTGTTLTIHRADTGAATPLNIAMNFSSMTSLTSRDSNLVMTEQDGSAIGTLNGFSIGANGIVTGSFSNGLTQTLGQVAIATFTNPNGLIDRGGNMFVTGANSGVPIITEPLSLNAGSIRAGALELSNVDLSKEFINLIISTTGFSASSRVISTSDRLLTELLNTTR